MSALKSPMSSKKILDTYFLDNRARLLDIASFLDRIDRAEDRTEGTSDFRYKAFLKALRIVLETAENRTGAIQISFSDLSLEPVEDARGMKASGAWKEAPSEDN